MAESSPSDLTPQQGRLWVNAKLLHDKGCKLIRLHRNGKRPYDAEWNTGAHLGWTIIEIYIRQGFNIGMVTGRASSCTVIDIDTYKGASIEDLPATQAVRTPRGGEHRYFKVADGIGNSAGELGHGIDVRGEGGQVVIAGSIIDGKEYEWLPGCSPVEIELAELPQWVIEKLTARTVKVPPPSNGPPRRGPGLVDRAKKYVDRAAPANEGSRNSAAFGLAGNLRALVEVDGERLTEAEIVTCMATWNARCRPPLPEQELLECIESSRVNGTPRPDKPSDSNGSAPDVGLPREWPSPEPLRTELPPVAPFDADLIPDTLRSWILDIFERVQCPLDFLAAALLVGLATVVGRRIGIKPKRMDDWIVVANLWGVLIGRPGILKTPAVQEVLRPLKRLELEEKKKFEEHVRKCLAEQFVEKQSKKLAEREVKDALESGQGDATAIANRVFEKNVANPTRKRFIVNDVTVEKLGELLNENPNGLLEFRDELMGFLRGMEKDGHECDRSFYLEAWNGTGRFTYDRIQRGTVDIEAATVSILGCIQPGPLSRYMSDAMNPSAADDGFIQRFQIAVWPDVSKDWTNVDRWPDTSAKARAYEVFKELAALDPVGMGLVRDKFEDDDSILALHFDADAQALFDDWREKLERRVRSGEEHPALESHFSKYRSLVPSIALLLHLADGGRGSVTAYALQRAIRWAAYLESHAMRIYSTGLNPDVTLAKIIERQIAKGKLKDGFTLRDTYRPQWSGLTRREDAERATNFLIDLGWLRSETTQTGGAPKTVFRINPKLRLHEKPPEGPDKTDGSRQADAASDENAEGDWGEV